MKKNVLLLINGFGVEQKDSTSIYSDSLMPNMDRLTKEGMFISISSDDLDYKDGYRCFSIGIKEALTYSIVNNDLINDTFSKNEVLKFIIEDHKRVEGKIHIMCYYDGEVTIYQLINYLKELTDNIKRDIYVHFILRNRSIDDYKIIEKSINNINYENGYNVKVGMVCGESYLQKPNAYKELIKMFVAESGEKWKEINKKFQVLVDSKTVPIESRLFAFNSGFGLSDNDSIFFYNYQGGDITPFTKELIAQKYKVINLSTIKFYSLFPLKCDNVNIPHMYEFGVSSTYLLNSLKMINASCLVMDKKDKCQTINQYLTGLRNDIDPALRYMPTDNGFIYNADVLLNTIINSPQELIIVNYELDDCKKVEDIQNRLKQIDVVIGKISEYTYNNKFGLFISSLYGIQKELYNSKLILCNVNFSKRVPVVFFDSTIKKADYTLEEGTTYDLANAIIHNINPAFKNSGLLKKKSAISKMFGKK
jgi:bisphosphoglycerate-independent phosphoglycerate mutase (AlkP superfamily)